jgi:hypothetical protein
MTWLTVIEYLCHINDHRYVPFVVSTSRSLPHSWLITGFVTRLTNATSGAGTAYPSGAPRFFLLVLVGFVLINVVKLYVFTFFSSVLWCPLRFPRKNEVLFIFILICYVLLMFLYLFTHTGVQQDSHIRWCSCC